jgi:hypothetical protein
MFFTNIWNKFFNKTPTPILPERTKSAFRIYTDIVSSWSIEGDIIIGIGTDMLDIAERDIRYLKYQFPNLEFDIVEIKPKYYGISTSYSEQTIQYIDSLSKVSA